MPNKRKAPQDFDDVIHEQMEREYQPTYRTTHPEFTVTLGAHPNEQGVARPPKKACTETHVDPGNARRLEVHHGGETLVIYLK